MNSGGRRVNAGRKATPARKARWDPPGRRDRRANLVLRGRPAPKASPVRKDLLDRKASPVRKDPKVRPDHKARPDPKVRPDHKATKGLPAQRGPKVKQDHKATKGLPAQRGPKVDEKKRIVGTTRLRRPVTGEVDDHVVLGTSLPEEVAEGSLYILPRCVVIEQQLQTMGVHSAPARTREEMVERPGIVHRTTEIGDTIVRVEVHPDDHRPLLGRSVRATALGQTRFGGRGDIAAAYDLSVVGTATNQPHRAERQDTALRDRNHQRGQGHVTHYTRLFAARNSHRTAARLTARPPSAKRRPIGPTPS